MRIRLDKKLIPFGNEDLASIRSRNDYYVDKTYFMRDLIYTRYSYQPKRHRPSLFRQRKRDRDFENNLHEMDARGERFP